MVSYCIPSIKSLSDNLRLHSTRRPSYVQANCTARQALFALLGFSVVNFIFTFPVLNTIDTPLAPI